MSSRTASVFKPDNNMKVSKLKNLACRADDLFCEVLADVVIIIAAVMLCAGIAHGQTTQPSAINVTIPASTQPTTVTLTTTIAVSQVTSASVTPATQPTSQPAAKMAIGTNIGGNDPWQTGSPWCDIAHQMSGWTAGSADPKTVYDANGYPQTPAFAHCWPYGYPSGKYHAHWSGSQTALNIAGKTLSPVAEGAGAWGSDVTFNSGDFVNLRATGPISDVHLWTPDAPQPYGSQTFRPAFIAALKPYKYVRLMPWARVNGEMQADPVTGKPAWPLQWSQRTLPTNWDQTSKEVALEYQFELAKESGCIPWIVTYYGESDDAVTQTATLARSYGFSLIVVEGGNEWWNQGAGYQGNLIRNDALAAGTYGATDPNVAGARRAASLGANVVKIFRGVLGASHVKGVFGAQAAWGAWASDGLSYAPAGSFDAVAVAPYFNNVSALPATATMSDWENSCSTWINTILDSGLAQNQAAAQAANVELWTYEAGQSLFPLMANAPQVPLQDTAANQTAFTADLMTVFQSDPAMGRLYDQLFAVCRKHNVTEFTHFLLAGYWGKSGYWGAKQMLTDPENAKTQAISRAIAAGSN